MMGYECASPCFQITGMVPVLSNQIFFVLIQLPCKAVLRIQIQLDPYTTSLSWIRIRILYTDPDLAAFKLITICNFFLLFLTFS